MSEPTCPSCGVAYVEHDGLITICQLRRQSIDYAIDLQRAIEAHCRGRVADESRCPHHAKMLNDHLLRERRDQSTDSE